MNPLIEKIVPKAVIYYLKDNGWTQISAQQDETLTFQLRNDWGLFQVNVPISFDIGTRQQLIQTIAKCTQISELRVISELLNPQAYETTENTHRLMPNRYLVKGKRADNSEWVMGYFLHLPSSNLCIHPRTIIAEVDYDDGADDFIFHIVDASTICSCVVAQDSCGKWLFEGDILNFVKSGRRGIVEWIDGDNKKWGYWNVRFINPEYNPEMPLEHIACVAHLNHFEVCGSIHDAN